MSIYELKGLRVIRMDIPFPMLSWKNDLRNDLSLTILSSASASNMNRLWHNTGKRPSTLLQKPMKIKLEFQNDFNFSWIHSVYIKYNIDEQKKTHNFMNVNEQFKFGLTTVENIMGKGENDGYQDFLLFPQCFKKASLSGSLKDMMLSLFQMTKFWIHQSS